MSYENIKERMDTCVKLYDETEDVKYLMEYDSICHFFEGGHERYEEISKYCIKNEFKKVFDIGCAYGFQSEVFLNNNINYVGIDAGNQNFWNKDKFQYVVNEYPFKIDANDEDLAISVLCLTWNCYLYEGETTLRKQCEALSRDFKNCLLYMQIDKLNIVKEYFKSYKIIKDNFVFFTS